MDDVYMHIMYEAFMHRLLPLNHETELTAMQAFGKQPHAMMVIVAMLASLAAYMVLYLLGKRMRHWPERFSTDAQRQRIAQMRKHAEFWLPYLLVLAPTPVGTAMLMAAGFFGQRAWQVAAICCVAELAWRWPIISGLL